MYYLFFCLDDDWLQISPQELEVMMKKAAGYLPADMEAPSDQSSLRQQKGHSTSAAGSRFEEDDVSGAPGKEELDLQSMVYGMKSFVDKISSHEGAELPWSEDYLFIK